MAKKKTKDTKGLSGIVNKVPREVDINGQLHMLAWITPKEGQTLKQLGGAGTLGPMGIPAYYDEGDDYSGPGGDQSADASGKQGPSDSSSSSSSSSSSDTSNDKGNDSYDADTGIDAETSDDYTPGVDVSDTYQGSVGTGFGSYKGGAYEGDTDKGPVSYSDKSAAPRDQRLFDGERGQAGYTQAQMQELEARDTGLSRAIQDRLKEGVYDIITDNKGNIVGVTSPAKGLPGSLARGLGSIIDAVMGTGGIDKYSGKYPGDIYDAVYTGRSQYDPFNTGDGRDGGGDDRGLEKKVVVTATDAAVSAVPTSPPSYYGQGVGTATTNLYDPTKIDPYLASLYGITPSPIGATYDAATSSYYMPGSKKDDKSRTRLRGLDIFKPVSTIS